MTMEGRNMIKSLRYTSLEEIDETVLKEILLDAFSVKDKKFWKT
ncbi:hypothetical protein [Maribacter antarcticus]|nr:hypothetical protein [Maribacter antarcticus]